VAIYSPPKKSCYQTKEFPQMKQLAPRNEKIQAKKEEKKKKKPKFSYFWLLCIYFKKKKKRKKKKKNQYSPIFGY